MGKSTCWNPDRKGRFDRPDLRNEETGLTEWVTENKLIRHTNYGEVSQLLNTSGCSKEEPYWIWDVLGVVETNKGMLVLSPGDYLNEFDDGSFSVSKEPVFVAEKRKTLALSKKARLSPDEVTQILLLVGDYAEAVLKTDGTSANKQERLEQHLLQLT